MKKIIKRILLLSLSLITLFCGCVADGSQSSSPQNSAGQNEENNQQGTEVMQTKTALQYYGYINDLSTFPVSFIYDNTQFFGFAPDKFKEMERLSSVEGEKELNVIYLSYQNKIKITLETAFYKNYDAFEWTVYFKNISDENSGVFEKLNGADIFFEGEKARLKGIYGDYDYQYTPYDFDLSEEKVAFKNTRGRATHTYFPYFNLQSQTGGTFIAIGWPGTWQAEFEYKEGKTHFKGNGVADLCAYLKPNEEIRTGLMAFVNYEGISSDEAQNKWRKWYIDCNMPKENAQSDNVVEPHTFAYLAFDTGTWAEASITETQHTWKRSLDALYDNGIDFDYRFFDAGWYYTPYKTTLGPQDWWPNVGGWELDASKWPNDTFKQSVDYAKSHGDKTIMWFESERVTHISDMIKNYGYNADWALTVSGEETFINNIADDDCREWLFSRIKTVMEENGVDSYREDFNTDPGVIFIANDKLQGDNRDGITENLYYQGHLQLWDDLIAWFAKTDRPTWIDSCASGGGRNDLESMRRAVPLMHSDSDSTTISLRTSMTTSLSNWLPYSGCYMWESTSQVIEGNLDIYTLRASYMPAQLITGAYSSGHYNFADLRKGLAEWQEIKNYFMKDFYNLTPWRKQTDNENWTAWMYFDEADDSGVIQVVRPEKSSESSYTVAVKGVDPNHYYSLIDTDNNNSVARVKGSALIKGYTISLTNPRQAAIIFIKPIK